MIARKLSGRSRILTDEREINRDNVLDVLFKAFEKHRKNQADIQYLLDYKGGEQPLLREKLIRPEIDIYNIINAAEYVAWFHTAYFWSQPPLLVQRSDVEVPEQNAEMDDSGINKLNAMLYNGENLRQKEIDLAEFVEVAGIGYMMADYKTEDDLEVNSESFANIYMLDPRYTFCVYLNAPGNRKMMGVSYSEPNGKRRPTQFTVYTANRIYEIKGLSKVNAEITERINLLGMIPIVEYTRAADRYGVFEHHMQELNSLNTICSDFANDVSQNVQEIKWANDIDFPTDKDGNPIKPTSGQWLLTHSGADKDPKIESIGSNLDRASALSTIQFQWNNVLQLCRVPVQYDSAGGGSTGTATSMASGWTTTELDAELKEGLIETAHKELLRLILKAIELVPKRYLPEEDPLRKVRLMDIDFQFMRNKSYDMTVKMNAFATGIKCGINGRHLLKWIEAFPDVEAVWLDSKDMIEAYQKAQVGDAVTSESSSDGDDRIASDNSDQIDTSPFIDGMTRTSGRGT